MKKLIGVIFFFIVSVNLLFADDKPYSIFGDVRIKSQSDWNDSYQHQFKCEATAQLDYNMPQTWAQIKLKVTNPYEISTGPNALLEIQKLLIGYNFFTNENSSLNIELGRNKLDDMFESKLQYDSHFNGINMVYSTESQFGSIKLHGGPHVIRSEMDHFGAIVELVASNIMDTRFTFKYSITDWIDTKNSDTRYAYLISQALLKYQLDENIGIYAAFLLNHKASSGSEGGYIGCQIGKINQAKDWMFDMNYQYLAANAVPDFDQSGIGKGVQVKGVYAVTDNFSMQAKLCTRKAAEISAIYKW